MMYVVAYETSSSTELFLLDHACSMDDVCNRRLFSIPSKLDLDAPRALTRASHHSIKSYFTKKIKESGWVVLGAK